MRRICAGASPKCHDEAPLEAKVIVCVNVGSVAPPTGFGDHALESLR